MWESGPGRRTGTAVAAVSPGCISPRGSAALVTSPAEHLVQHAPCAMPPGQTNALLQANSASGNRRWKEETHVAAELFYLPGPSVCAQPRSSAESHLVACPTTARGGKEMPLGLCSPSDLHPLLDTSVSISSSEIPYVQAQRAVLTTQEEELQVHSSSCSQWMGNMEMTCATKDYGASASSTSGWELAGRHNVPVYGAKRVC